MNDSNLFRLILSNPGSLFLTCRGPGELAFLEQLVDCGSKTRSLILGQVEVGEVEDESIDKVVETLLQPSVRGHYT